MHGASGEIEGFIAVVRDITERKRAEEALRVSEEKLRIMFESMHDSMMVTDLMGNVVDANEAALQVSGYSREELLGRNAMELIAEKDRERLMELMMQNISEGGGTENLECAFIVKGGKEIEVESSSSMLYDGDGNAVGFITISRDITERKRMQEQINRMVDDLKRSNAELEQFAYVASHDLQEPLRMISSYTQLLARRYKGKLEAEADEFIEFAVDGASRMQTMIQALLTYSRVGTRGKPPEPTDCDTVLALATKNLQTALEESGAEVTNDPLPTVMADDVQMVQLFQNLIGNGIKFQGEGVRPHVQVSVEDQGDEWLFSFKDNGIGIDPEYKERIFVIFQRLHNKQSYKGTGIGLSVCKKIVERHGGRIWVESELGEGATFYFTIPKYREEAKEEATNA
jgi:PAS domain S-box-containing protein